MADTWLGKRRHSLRLVSGRDISERELRVAARLLHASHSELEQRMGATLLQVRENAMRSPFYAANRSAWAAIRDLDDLATAPYTSSNLLPLMTGQAPDWRGWVANGEAVVAMAATSGSTGRSRLMPFSSRSLEINAQSSVPHLAHITLERGLPKRRVALTLTAPKGYISYLAMPDGLAAGGYDVLHVPLASVLNDPGVALDLVEWVLEPANQVHVIATVTAMLPMFIAALREQPGGTEALEKMRESLRFIQSGGSELTPTLEAIIRSHLGLAHDAYMNFFGSTEAGMAASSREEFSLFHGSLHTHVLSLIPLEELRKEEADPEYRPRNVLLTRAPVGLVGELVNVYDGALPWINLRQGDIFEVAEPLPGTDMPRLRHLARMSSMHDVAGGRVWPASYQEAMDRLDGKVSDYLAMALKPGDHLPEGVDPILVRDKLVFYYEGSADIGEVAGAIFDTIPILVTAGPNLGSGSFEMEVVNVTQGALRRCRQRKSAEQCGAPGPLKHRVVRGPQYHIPFEDVICTGPGWVPRDRESCISPLAAPIGRRNQS